MGVKHSFRYGWREELRYKVYALLEFMFPRWWCGRCRTFSLTVARRHMNTCYHDEESNYATTCLPCFEEIEDDWQAMWDEYWAGRF